MPKPRMERSDPKPVVQVEVATGLRCTSVLHRVTRKVLVVALASRRNSILELPEALCRKYQAVAG